MNASPASRPNASSNKAVSALKSALEPSTVWQPLFCSEVFLIPEAPLDTVTENMARHEKGPRLEDRHRRSCHRGCRSDLGCSFRPLSRLPERSVCRYTAWNRHARHRRGARTGRGGALSMADPADSRDPALGE